MRNTSHFGRLTLAALLGAATVTGMACCAAAPNQPIDKSEQPVPKSGGGAKADPNQPIQPLNKHSIQTPQLQGLMKVIAMTAAEHTPKTLPGDVETPPPTKAELDKSYKQAAILADALVTAADRIPFAIEGKEIPEETRKGFLAEAKILKETAQNLKQHAESRQGESMMRSLDRINATCITCHSKYRDLSGAMDFPRAEGLPMDRTKVARQD